MPLDSGLMLPPAARTPTPEVPLSILGSQEAENGATSRHLPEARSPSASSQSRSFLEGTPQAGLTSLFGITPVQRGRVWFNSPQNSSVDITPYSRIYGVHPRFFDFDAVGDMQLTPAAAKAARAWRPSPSASEVSPPQTAETPMTNPANDPAATDPSSADGPGWPTCSRRAAAAMLAAADNCSARSCSPPVSQTSRSGGGLTTSAEGSLASTARLSGTFSYSARSWSPPPSRIDNSGGAVGRDAGNSGEICAMSSILGQGQGQSTSLAARSRAKLGGEGTAPLGDRGAAHASSHVPVPSWVTEAPSRANGVQPSGSHQRPFSTAASPNATPWSAMPVSTASKAAPTRQSTGQPGASLSGGSHAVGTQLAYTQSPEPRREAPKRDLLEPPNRESGDRATPATAPATPVSGGPRQLVGNGLWVVPPRRTSGDHVWSGDHGLPRWALGTSSSGTAQAWHSGSLPTGGSATCPNTKGAVAATGSSPGNHSHVSLKSPCGGTSSPPAPPLLARPRRGGA